MGFCVFNWIIPFHCCLLLGCVDKTMCSNDGTLTFEIFIFPSLIHKIIILIYLYCVKPPAQYLPSETFLFQAKTNVGKVSMMSSGIHRIIWGLSGTMKT